jgi:hypothetical protein
VSVFNSAQRNDDLCGNCSRGGRGDESLVALDSGSEVLRERERMTRRSGNVLMARQNILPWFREDKSRAGGQVAMQMGDGDGHRSARGTRWKQRAGWAVLLEWAAPA